jgi:hypothetical protein
MAVELLGANLLPHAVIVCVLSYVMTGQRGIYNAQRFLRSKDGRVFSRPTALRELSRKAAPSPSRSPE